MNLVAKGFVAARDDGRGVLVLSEFTGSAQQLTGAILVNPYDVDGVPDVLALALTVAYDDKERRIAEMRRQAVLERAAPVP